MFNKRATLAITCLATAMLMLDIAVVNTALPRIGHQLHSGLGGLQWIVDAYTLALATLVLNAGSLADRFGRRRVFGSGMAVFTASSLACALAGSITALDSARAIQGIGAAMLFASSLAILADAYPSQDERAKAFAAYGATIGASFAVGPLVGGALTSGLSWQAVFYVNVPLGLLAIVGTHRWVRESRHPAGRPLDWPGQITLSAGLFLLVLGALRANADGWTSLAILGELTGGVGCLSIFLVVERFSDHPMLPLHLFRRPTFTAAQVSAFAVSASLFAVFLYTTLYLQGVLGLSPIDAGLAYLPGTIALFVVSAVSAQLMTRVSAGVLIVSGLGLVAAGLALMTNAGSHSSWVALLPGLIVACIGTGLINPALAGVAIGSLDDADSGLAAGVNDAFRQGGIAIGVAAFGALVPTGMGVGHASTSAYVSALHQALFIGAGVSAFAAIVTARLIIVRRSIPAPSLETSVVEPAAVAGSA